MPKPLALVMLIVAAQFASASAEDRKTATAKDFREFCSAREGRWVGEVKWDSDWPGLGQKGEGVAAYLEGQTVDDDSGFLLRMVGGSGSGTRLYAYDAARREIRAMWVLSSGYVATSRVYREGNEWVEEVQAGLADGVSESFTARHRFPGAANTLIVDVSRAGQSEPEVDSNHTWRRVSRQHAMPREAIDKVTRAVEKRITEIAAEAVAEKHWVTHYGANHIHPRHLVFWICVQSDRERDRLKSDQTLMKRLRQTLVDSGYPEAGRDGVHIGFESQETVDRVSKGNWFYHWK